MTVYVEEKETHLLVKRDSANGSDGISNEVKVYIRRELVEARCDLVRKDGGGKLNAQ